MYALQTANPVSTNGKARGVGNLGGSPQDQPWAWRGSLPGSINACSWATSTSLRDWATPADLVGDGSGGCLAAGNTRED